jgi:hypothetical protein
MRNLARHAGTEEQALYAELEAADVHFPWSYERFFDFVDRLQAVYLRLAKEASAKADEAKQALDAIERPGLRRYLCAEANATARLDRDRAEARDRVRLEAERQAAVAERERREAAAADRRKADRELRRQEATKRATECAERLRQFRERHLKQRQAAADASA